MLPRFRIPFALAIAAGLVLTAPVARAQSLTRDRVQLALDLTDRRIEQAAVVLGASDDARARTEFGVANDVQARAKSTFAGGQFGISLQLTLEARGHADRVIALIRGLPDPDRVRAQLERTRDLLARAREQIEECSVQNIERARALMATAFAVEARADDAVSAGRYLAALQLTMNARERGLAALRLCNMVENHQEAAERALRRTDDLIERAREAVDDRRPGGGRNVLQRSLDVQQQAWNEVRAERYDAALRLTQTARALAYRALRLSGRGA